jgi:hypothetical protein
MTEETEQPRSRSTLDAVEQGVVDEVTALSRPAPPPGSLFLAEQMERRRFLRRASTSIFMGFVAVSSGAAGLMDFLVSPAQAATGACCPTTNSCCGPSPCCNTSCCRKGCCPLNSDHCTDNQVTCFGPDNRYWGPRGGGNCWSCYNPNTMITIVCCDCLTNNDTNCSNGGLNRCICYFQGHFAPPKGIRLITDARHLPAFRKAKVRTLSRR